MKVGVSSSPMSTWALPLVSLAQLCCPVGTSHLSLPVCWLSGLGFPNGVMSCISDPARCYTEHEQIPFWAPTYNF